VRERGCAGLAFAARGVGAVDPLAAAGLLAGRLRRVGSFAAVADFAGVAAWPDVAGVTGVAGFAGEAGRAGAAAFAGFGAGGSACEAAGRAARATRVYSASLVSRPLGSSPRSSVSSEPPRAR
jgi:hypothetical protein